jgi:hypothetical protein
MSHSRRLLVLLALLLGTTVQAQPPQAPPPAKYKVTLRYSILATRDLHVMAYDGLIKHLQKLNFDFDPPRDKVPDTDREDRSKNYLRGTIESSKALKILDDPVVQSVLLVPDGFDLPPEVMVRLQLGGNLSADRQRELANQLRVLLRELGFKEAVAYDHRGYTRRPQTRVVGTIPKDRLEILLRDLRNHPAGWLGPILPRVEIPTPLGDVNPVRVIEVLPDTEPIKDIPDPESRGNEAFNKISAEVWELVKDKEVKEGHLRIQAVLNGKVAQDDRAARSILRDAAPDFFIDGQLGQFVTGTIRLDQIKPLASSSLVGAIRLPRVMQVNVDPAVKIKGDTAKALELTKLKELHERGYKGKGVRLAIIDRDFRGWEALVKKKQLPAGARLVDLTTELDPEIYPKAYAGNADEIGHGTLCAQAAALAAPEIDLTLIRIETVDPYSLYEVIRYVQGGYSSPLLDRREGELNTRNAQLRARRALLLEERRLVLSDFNDETDEAKNLEFLGNFYSWLYSDRQWHRQRMAIHEKLEAEHRQRETRFAEHFKSVNSLEGIGILVNALSWQSGYPLGGNSPLTRLLDDPKGPLWFQAVGNTRGQSWLGPYRNTPGDPAMKFTDDDTKLPKDRWSNEINFIGWQPYGGEFKADLPEKARLRVTLQWREPHDPDYYQPDEIDHYRRPLAELRLQLVRQRDAETKTLPGDSFELVARSMGLPERIEHLPGGSVYEHVIEASLEKGGRAAIRVEKQVSSQWVFAPHPERKTPMFKLLKNLTPTGIRPLGAPTLPALERDWELRCRVFVEVIDDASRVQGRAVLADFATDAGSIGIPADGRNVISVGAASFQNKPQPYSAFGSPPGSDLARRPSLYAYDELDLAAGGAFGTSIANAFAAGTTASMLSGKISRDDVLQMLRDQEGQVLRVPIGKK